MCVVLCVFCVFDEGGSNGEMDGSREREHGYGHGHGGNGESGGNHLARSRDGRESIDKRAGAGSGAGDSDKERRSSNSSVGSSIGSGVGSGSGGDKRVTNKAPTPTINNSTYTRNSGRYASATTGTS